MSAILRNNIVVDPKDKKKVDERGAGSGQSAVAPAKNISKKWRHSEDPAFELMVGAEFLGQEPDIPAILEGYHDSPFDPSKRRVLGRLMGIFAMDYQGAKSEERNFLKRLLASRNAKEGYVANRALHMCRAPNVIRRTLALAVAHSRLEHGPIRGFIGAVQARIAATTFLLLGPGSQEMVWNLLMRCGLDARGAKKSNADRVLERALILKALAARRTQLGPWQKVEGPIAMQEISQFATEIRGVAVDELAMRTCIWEDSSEVETTYTHSSVAACLRYARGEIDPIWAWREHREDKSVAKSIHTLGYDEEVFPDLERNPLLERPRLHQALAEARLHAHLEFDTVKRQALCAYIAGEELSARMAEQKTLALDIISQLGFDVVQPETLEIMRRDAQGIYRFDAAHAFGLLTSRYTGATYVRRLFSDVLTSGIDPVSQIQDALQCGMPVPLIIYELKKTATKPLLVWEQHEGVSADQVQVAITDMSENKHHTLLARDLVKNELPVVLGKKTRVDAYFAPLALDLLAPPFGFPLPSLGLEDRL